MAESTRKLARPRHTAPLTAILAATLALVPSAVLAHSGPPPVPETLWSTWHLDPPIAIGLVLGLWGYLRGVRMLRSRRTSRPGVSGWRIAAGLAGFTALVIALVSPLDPLSTALFSAHMGQHMLLIALAPPLLVLGNVGVLSIWAIPEVWRGDLTARWRQSRLHSVWGVVARPLPALVIHGLVLWAWHVPSLYNAAVRIEFIHALEHVTLLGSGMLFWWQVINGRNRPGVRYGLGLLIVAGAVLQKTALGALVSFSPAAWYSEHAATTAAWGLTPLEDQQLAGAVMMVPGGTVYLIAGVLLFAGWIRAIERSVERDERLATERLDGRSEREPRAKETI